MAKDIRRETKNNMHEDEKWNAVVSCDNCYDGVFYYAVKTTGIFCRPSCKAKTPLKRNICFFDTIHGALLSGFRPCKLCRPDIGIYDPNMDLVKKTKEKIVKSYNKSLNLNNIALEFSVSESHLARLFKNYYHITPNEYLIKVRIDKSKELLKTTNRGIMDIAYDVGFKSLSNFYKCFKEKVNTTPRDYRKNCSDNKL